MNKILFTLTTAMVLMTALHADNLMVDKSKFEELKTLNNVLQDPVLTIKGAMEKTNSYILKLEVASPQGSRFITAFLDKKTSEIYMGSAYDKEGNALTFPKDVQVVKDAVSFSYGKGSKNIYIVTDPECSYCVKLEKAIAGKLDDYTVHVILFPLSFHKKAPAMVEWILAGKNNEEKKKNFEEIMMKGSTAYKALIKDEKKPFVYSSAIKQQMDKTNKASMELNVRGTPAIFDENLNPFPREALLQSKGKKK